MDVAYGGYAPPAPLPPPCARTPEPFRPGVQAVTPAAPPVPAMPCAMSQSARTEPHGCSVRVVSEDGTDHLRVEGNDIRMTCDQLALQVQGHKSVKLAIAGKQVAISSTGMQARADRIAMHGADDRLVLEGHARLQYCHGDAGHGEVTAERIVLNLSTGQLEISSAGSMNQHTQAPAPPSLQETFSVWMGMFH
jgi:hypothetical protein